MLSNGIWLQGQETLATDCGPSHQLTLDPITIGHSEKWVRGLGGVTQHFPNPGENHSGSEPRPSTLSQSLLPSLLILSRDPSGRVEIAFPRVFCRKGCLLHPASSFPRTGVRGTYYTVLD